MSWFLKAETKFVRKVKGYTRLDKLRNQYIRQDFDIGLHALKEKIQECRCKQRNYLTEWMMKD